MANSTVPTSFLTYGDFKAQIKSEDLLQIIDETNTNVSQWSDLSQYTQNVLIQSEQQAIEEISSYVRGRYLTQEVFAPTQVYSSGTTYFGKNLVIYNAANYNTAGISATTVVYNVGDEFNYEGIIYTANTAISGGTIDPRPLSTYVTEQDALYFANLPVAEYSQNTTYQKGNLVWFEDNIYQAKQNVQGKTPATSQNLELRFGVPSAQEYLGYYTVDFDTQPNPLPTVNSNNWILYNGPVSSWFTGTTYYFSGVNPTQNTTYWTKGDNRNPQIVLNLIDILLYHLHSRINPNQIPMLRNIRYDGASPAQLGGSIGWLKNVQRGKVSLNLPEIVQTQGLAIRFGSTPKNNNSF